MNTLFSRLVPLVCAALLAGPAVLRAQDLDGVSAGLRVRVVEAGTGRVVGTVTAVRGDTLEVRTGTGDRARVHAFSASSIRSLQVSRGRTPRHAAALKGAAVGTLSGVVGGVGGAVIPILLADENCGQERARGEDTLCFTTGEWAMIGVIVGAPIGALTGAVAGFLFPPERWRSVGLPSAPAVTLDGHAGGVQLGVTVRF
jgi:hypothetical protein